MVDKIKNFALRWKYEAIIFVMTMLPVFFNFNKLSHIHRMYIPYYLYDFSMGFNARMWVGSIVKILNSHPTEEWIRGFATVILILGMILTAIALGKTAKKTAAENRFTMLVFVLFFISGSLSISLFSRFFGMLDIHMYIIALVCVVFSQNKYLRWFVPALCVAGVFVNFVFGISYFPLVVLSLLYNADKDEKKHWHIVIFVLTVIPTIGVTLYTVFAAAKNMTVTPEEAIQMMENKIGHPLTAEQNEYALLYLFGQNERASDFFGKPISDMTPIEYVSNYFRFFAENSFSVHGIFNLALITVPVIAVFWALWISCIRNAERKSTKFVYVCYILSTFFIPVGCLLSTDLVRWVASGVMCQFALCFLMFYFRDSAFEETVEAIKRICSKNKIIPVVIYILYASSLYLDLTT